jgi:hypothetical protein
VNKKLLGAFVVVGAAAIAAYIVREKLIQLGQELVREAAAWSLDDPGEDEEGREMDEDLAAFEAGEKRLTEEPKGPRGWGQEVGEGEIS